MRLMAMSVMFSAAIIAYSATDMSLPIPATWTTSGTSAPAVSAASASIAPMPPAAAHGIGIDLPAVEPVAEAAHVRGYAIAADHPRPPLGRFKLTAYSGPQGGKVKAITATGTSARAGRTVAVDPAVIPLGSHLFIEGVGERIAEDVGGGVRGNHIDVYVPSLPEASRFGVKHQRAVSVIAANAPH